MPSNPGSASGLRNAPCRTAPDRPRPPPTSAASKRPRQPDLQQDQPIRQRQDAVADQQGNDQENEDKDAQEAQHAPGFLVSANREAPGSRNRRGNPRNTVPVSFVAHRANKATARAVNGPAQMVSGIGSARRGMPATAGLSSRSVASDGYSGSCGTTSRSGG